MTANTKAIKRQAPPPATAGQLFSASLKAGFFGGLAVSLLLALNQISFPLKGVLILPAMLIVWIVTGIASAMLAGNLVRTSKDGRKAGAIAGIISGVISGIAAMLIAALGNTFTGIGQGVLAQFSEAQLASMAASGFSQEMVILAGATISALFVCGIGGMIVSGLLGGFGGWLYPKFGD